jgi:hypothetical protein
MKKQMKKKNIPGQSPDPRFDTEVTIRAAARRLVDTHRRLGTTVNPFAPGSMQFLEYNSQYFGRRN